MVGQIDDVLQRHRDQSLDTLGGDHPPVDLAPLVRRVVAEHQQTRECCTISLQMDEGALIGTWDASNIERVLSNLLSNAVKYSRETCRIDVRLHREVGTGGPEIVLNVRDRGIGMPAADLPHIFEHYYRASNAGDIAGVGIGLSGVNAIVRQYGGTASAQSDEHGTIMTIRLPLNVQSSSS